MSGVIQKYKVSKNLYDGLFETGYYNDSGVLITEEDTTSHTTTYIPITTNKTFTISNLWYNTAAMSNFAVYEWDENKQWLRRSNRQYPPASKTITFTVGDDCKYFTLQIQTNYPSDLMLNVGLTPLPYEPFETENLLDYSTFVNDYWLNNNTGLPQPYNNGGRIATTSSIDVNNVNNVTFNFKSEVANTLFMYSLFNGSTLIERVSGLSRGTTIDVSNGDTLYLCLYRNTALPITISDVSNAMLNTGSTPLPYTPYGTIWKDIPYARLETATDTITALPKTIYTDGNNIGVNLLDKSTFVVGKWINASGNITDNDDGAVSTQKIYVQENEDYTFKNYATGGISISGVAIGIYDSNNNFSRRVFSSNSETSFTIQSGESYFIVGIAKTSVTQTDINSAKLMLNVGSTALPYQPYSGIVVKGNMSQSGTPTPTSPITPSECGERTTNYWDTSKIINKDGYYINGNTQTIQLNDYAKTIVFPLEPNTSYTILRSADTNRYSLALATTSEIAANTPVDVLSTVLNIYLNTFTTQTNNIYLVMYYAKADAAGCPTAEELQQLLNSIQLVKGTYTTETMPPYEPYGYKLPIVSGGVTTNVYLSEVQSTRKIKKYTFTGEETVSNCVATTDGQNYCAVFRYDAIGMSDIIDYEQTMANIIYPQYVSSHFVNKTDNYDDYKTIYNGQIGANDYGSTGQARNRYIIFCVAGLTTAEDYSAWFAQQYANGTPVEVYYILETATTGIVNEPIRKIGNYVDTVTNPVSIPTTSGGQTFDVDTSLKPSEVELTYHGWHEHEAEKYSRTENLFNYAEVTWVSGIKDDNGNTTSSIQSHFTDNYTEVKSNTEYSIDGFLATGVETKARIYFYDGSHNWISRTELMYEYPTIITTPANCKYVQFQCPNEVNGSAIMFVEGSYTSQTMPSYQPYLDWQ